MTTATKAELLERFRQERYLFKPPPVYTGQWSDWDWCRFILSYGGFGKVELAKPYQPGFGDVGEAKE